MDASLEGAEFWAWCKGKVVHLARPAWNLCLVLLVISCRRCEQVQVVQVKIVAGWVRQRLEKSQYICENSESRMRTLVVSSGT